MKKVFPIFLLSVIILCSFSQSGWQNISLTYDNCLADIQFVNEYTGFMAVGRYSPPGAVYKTTDGGLSWSVVFLTSKPMKAIFFSDANTGTVVGQRTNLRRTYTGGSIWYWFAPVIGNNSINSVYFRGDKTGWVGGDSSYIFRTNDYGATWTNLTPNNFNITWNDIYFFDLNTGIVAGTSGSHNPIFRTTNSGDNWIEIPGAPANWKRISFCDELNGFIAGASATSGLLKTTDGGLSWESVGNISEYNDVYCVNSSIAYAVSNAGRIHKTTDGGEVWTVTNSGTNESLYGIYFMNALTGLVCGDNGVILKTTTGGIIPIGVQQTGTMIPEKFSLEQNYPNPFNPTTHFGFRISELGLVKLTIYSVVGNEITTLVNEKLNSGTYEVSWDASSYPSGTYFYRLQVSQAGSSTGDYAETKKMVLLK